MLEQEIVIAGGGVSGLYCATRLAEAGHRVLILEASSDRWGGRIETEDMDGFIAEYGPMRFEPTLQPRFAQLCAELGVRLVDFSGPSSDAVNAIDSELLPEEQGLNSLQLLKRGIMLIMGRDPNDQAWIDSLTEADYYRLRKHAQLLGQPLWATGFWNAMSAQGVLSHRALVKLRDTGTFYHMIPENLNAIEWIIWWLRALKTVGQKLASIEGGSSRLTEGLMAKIQSLPNITLAGGHTLLGFRPTGLGQASMELDVRTKNGTIKLQAGRLVLALPRMPLVKLSPHLPEHIASHLAPLKLAHRGGVHAARGEEVVHVREVHQVFVSWHREGAPTASGVGIDAILGQSTPELRNLGRSSLLGGLDVIQCLVGGFHPRARATRTSAHDGGGSVERARCATLE